MVEKAIFREYPTSKEPIALFPEVPGDPAGKACLGYTPISRWGPVDYGAIMANTVPAKAMATGLLRRALAKEEYEVEEIKKYPGKHDEKRAERKADYRLIPMIARLY
jgi:hypothetical protein